MTVPTKPQPPHSGGLAGDSDNRPVRARRIRKRRLVAVGVAALGVSVVSVVLAFPRLAAPIGTSAGVVAAVAPLVQRAGRSSSSDDEPAGEP
jgi:hypothetical protein